MAVSIEVLYTFITSVHMIQPCMHGCLQGIALYKIWHPTPSKYEQVVPSAGNGSKDSDN